MSNEVLELAKQLIQCESVTPNDGGCQTLITQRLKPLNFVPEHLPAKNVHNLWARRNHSSPLFVFAGHTDVVPTGDLARWDTPPFQPLVDDGWLYGRGACDMKTGIASMIVAIERFVHAHPHHQGSLAVLITSDEEGIAEYGTKHVMNTLTQRGEKIDWCLVGEPSSSKRLGDVVRIGRRGSLSGELSVFGSIGHVAFPELTPNVLHETIPLLQQMIAHEWDQGNADFQPTSFQISNLHVGTGADNVIPGELFVQFNFRFNNEHVAENLQKFVEKILCTLSAKLQFELKWRIGGVPFISHHGKLRTVVTEVVHEFNGIEPILSTGGGTSDARFIAPTDAETIELGHINATAHQYNERVRVDDLDQLAQLYQRILERLLVS